MTEVAEDADPFAGVIVEADVTLDTARRVAFLLSAAETALGIPLHNHSSPGRTLQERISAVLAGAMERPAAIDVDTYTVFYRLRDQGMTAPMSDVVESAVASADTDRGLL